MANRFSSPFTQQLDSTVSFLSGGLLYFYVTETTTPTDTYSDSDLQTANANPVVLDSLGRHGAIFLDPSVTYKVVLKDADDNEIDSADPIVDPAANVTASFQVYAGDPNGNVAGNAGSVGGSGASVVWDITNQLLYICTTTGTASTAVWTEQGAALSGAVAFSGTISPSSISTQQDDYAPAGIAAATSIRITPGADVDITGISASQTAGRTLLLQNIDTTYIVTLKDQDANSTAANRFLFGADMVIYPLRSLAIEYDAVSSRWRTLDLITGRQSIYLPASALLPATTSGPAPAQLESSTNKINYAVLDFDASADEYAHFNIPMPKSWNLGTIKFRVQWSTTATDTDGVAWGLQAVAIADGDAIDTALGTAVVVTDVAQSAAGDVLTTAISDAVTIAGSPAAGELSFFRLFRDVSDAADVMAEDARLIGIEIFYDTISPTDN